MPGPIECNYIECNIIFKAKRNQRYHSKECSKKGRRLKERLRKRKERKKKSEEKIQERVKKYQPDLELVRKLKKRKKYIYKCDTCQKKTKRYAKELNVYCNKECRVQTRNKLKRLARSKNKKAYLKRLRSLPKISSATPQIKNQNKKEWSPGFPRSP